MNFSDALREARDNGHKIARRGWNGKDMWVAVSPGNPKLAAESFWSYQARRFAEERGGHAEVLPCLIMKTADNKIQLGWLASQSDLLARDWEIVPTQSRSEAA